MKRKPDLMSILGWLFSIVLMFIGMVLVHNTPTAEATPTPDPNAKVPAYEIKMDNLGSFWDATSIFIVMGGTMAVLMVSFPLKQITKIPKHMKIIFAPKQYEPQMYIEKLVECAKKARINGLLALEEEVNEMEDAFMKSSMLMVVDSVDPEKVKQQLESWMDNLEERHSQERAFYDKGAVYAPAFGMIGTLIGLINMMKQLDSPETVGPNMAVALITTFYGSLLSNVVFMPISNKLKVRHEEEYLCKLIICEGVEAIQAGENPKFIQDRLVNILPEYQQRKLVSAEDGEDVPDGKKGKKAKPPKEKKAKKEK